MSRLLAALNDATAPDNTPIKIIFYQGTRPATPDTAITGQVKLAELHVGNSMLGQTDFYTVNSNPDGYTVQLNVPNRALVEVSGVANFFRIVSETGFTVLEGDISDRSGSGELKLPTTNLIMGQAIKANSFTLTIPYSY